MLAADSRCCIACSSCSSSLRREAKVAPTLAWLHWLPVLPAFCWSVWFVLKAVNARPPHCLTELLHFRTPARPLRLADRLWLEVPMAKLWTKGKQAFRVRPGALDQPRPAQTGPDRPRPAQTLEIFKGALCDIQLLDVRKNKFLLWTC